MKRLTPDDDTKAKRPSTTSRAADAHPQQLAPPRPIEDVSPPPAEASAARLRELLASHSQWLCAETHAHDATRETRSGAAHSIRRGATRGMRRSTTHDTRPDAPDSTARGAALSAARGSDDAARDTTLGARRDGAARGARRDGTRGESHDGAAVVLRLGESLESAAVVLRAGEWDVGARGGAVHFSYRAGEAWRVWRVIAWERAGAKLLLSVARRAGAERATVELVPRASIGDAARAIREARLAECARLAALACAQGPDACAESEGSKADACVGGERPSAAARVESAGLSAAVRGESAMMRADVYGESAMMRADARVESVRLSAGARRGEPGRYARVLLRFGARRVAVTGPVAPVRAHETDALLAAALRWWSRLGAHAGTAMTTRVSRRHPNTAARLAQDLAHDDASQLARVRAAAPSGELWLVGPRELAAALAERLPLLREGVRRAIKLLRIEPSPDTSRETLTPVEPPALAALLACPPGRRFDARAEPTETAARLASVAPAEIDVVRARRGETLRFRGLPFARVRRLAGREQVWFGVPGAGRAASLGEENWPQLVKLVDDLSAHRRAGAPDPRHAFYRAAPEAWLESLLRRDITRLDPGLVVSPLHAQLRLARERGGGARPVDLLALRRDGRLVVIELKVTEDAALPLQGADYWRRIEARRRSGDIARARLFGPLAVADAPALVYLVAPVFRFHRAFPEIARLVAPDIELYRFDINEDWRAGVRVVRRARVN